jgi:hypothetical protein
LKLDLIQLSFAKKQTHSFTRSSFAAIFARRTGANCVASYTAPISIAKPPKPHWSIQAVNGHSLSSMSRTFIHQRTSAVCILYGQSYYVPKSFRRNMLHPNGASDVRLFQARSATARHLVFSPIPIAIHDLQRNLLGWSSLENAASFITVRVNADE